MRGVPSVSPWFSSFLFLAAACHGDFGGRGQVDWPASPADEVEDHAGGARAEPDAGDALGEDPGPDPADASAPEPVEPVEPIDAGRPDAAAEPEPDPVFGGPSVCTSGAFASAETNEDGSAEMFPGRACIACHLEQDDGPELELAGTVYATGHEPDNCEGGDPAGGEARIEVTDADGKVVTMTANAAGNFFSSSGVRFPIKARVLLGDRSRAMLGAVSSGDCNSCHGETGSSGAPGRIALP